MRGKRNKGNEVPIEAFVEEEAEPTPDLTIEIPKQYEFFKVPRRFGSIPVDELPLGCDLKEQYYKEYPRIALPFQRVERISFGHPELEPNRLFWGDNLHIMRLLPSNSIDLIYLDPPFFSGRNYNIIFGDQNEIRSFTDIWDGGMPGYQIWLNARLLEMKRLLRPTGSIYVHLDWHASHYVKVEMDKMFGYDNLRNEIVWYYYNKYSAGKSQFPRAHDIILVYSKTDSSYFNPLREKREQPAKQLMRVSVDGVLKNVKGEDGKVKYRIVKDKKMDDVWRIPCLQPASKEWIGYPTQKHPDLIERIINASCPKNGVVADFFVGGGTTPAVAQRLGRRWIACDISRIAVSITADRVIKVITGKDDGKIQQVLAPTPDISIEHWGVYEVERLTKMTDRAFRHFIIQSYNGRITTGDDVVHGYKRGIPLYVGPASQEIQIGKNAVLEFAKTITTKKGKHQGTMLAWGFAPSAWKVAEQLALQQAVAVDFVKISLVPIESEEFREHVTSKHSEYRNFLKFILPPEVRLNYKRVAPLTYEFDVSESVSLNSGSKIINVQWDFDHKGRFVSTLGYAFAGLKNKKPILKATYKFPSSGNKKIACRVQDDEGGQKIAIVDLRVR